MKRFLDSVKFFACLVVFTFTFFLFGSTAYSKSNHFRVVAKVNDEVITEHDLNNRHKLMVFSIKNNVNAKERREIKNQALEQLIDEKIKKQHFVDKKIDVEEKELASYIREIEKSQGFGKGGLKKYLREFSVSWKTYHEKLRTDLLWNKLIVTQIRPNIFVFEYETNEAAEYILENPDRVRFDISEIFIPIKNVGDKERKELIAKKLAKEIRRNDNFEDLVQKFSRSSTAKDMGKIGWVDEKDLNQDIFGAIKNLNKGGVSDPVFIGQNESGGFYIFKLNDKKKERIVKEEEIGRIKTILFNQKLEREVKKYLDKLHQNSFVEIYD